MGGSSPEDQLAQFSARFLPHIAEQGNAALAFLRERYPATHALVYDNYNALAVGLSADTKRAGIILSVTFYPRWISIFFTRGVELDDPEGLLEGAGTSIRHIKLVDHNSKLDQPAILTLVEQAVDIADPALPASGQGELIIQSISANQRPRRP